ncbi:uncharacterized protein LOC111073414 [Drosophila obscura]|uniref:uncharacterized protein LOC111073414 n=1 Tax=Drosophila obscura TaxID=7282 RepID=UPI001BB25A23|nr:uncharacterized protein LOC111073414 [Drosophila obscura]
MRNLQFVKIWQGGRHSVSKRVLRVLKDSSQLRQLHICTPKLETRDVRKLEQLEIFSIDVDLTAKGLLHSCRTMTNLRTLRLTDQVSSARLREVLVHLPHIRDLSFCINRCVSKHSKLLDCCRDASSSLSRLFDFLASQRSTLVALSVKGPICAVHEAESLVRIKSLKSLDCNFSSPDFVLLLRELPSLRVLRITYLQPIDISYAYLHLVRQCRELRFLRIFDYNINPDFVRKASEVLEDVEAKKPLQLLIHGRHSSATLREFTSMAEDRKNLLFRSITASELFTLI